MAVKPKTVLKNFRFSRGVSSWLKKKSRATGQSQTRILTDALQKTYRMKGRLP